MDLVDDVERENKPVYHQNNIENSAPPSGAKWHRPHSSPIQFHLLQVCFWVAVTVVSSVVATFIQAGYEFPFIPLLERVRLVKAVALSHASAMIHTSLFECIAAWMY